MTGSSPATRGRVVRSMTAGDFVVIESEYAPGTTLPPHQHDRACLSFAVRGTFSEVIGSRTIECAPFDVLLRPAGVAHANVYGPSAAGCVLIETTKPVIGVPAVIRRRDVFARWIHRELSATDDVAPLVIEGLAHELIAGAERDAGVPRWFAPVREYVHAHADGRVTLDELASVAGVHPASVVRAFRAHLGSSPGDYVRRLRIEHACRALTSTRRPIAQIALDAGFFDQSHFTAAFRRYVGVTPAAYRASALRHVR